MLFLTRTESTQWAELGREIAARQIAPFDLRGKVRDKLIPCFRCYAGGMLMSKGMEDVGWKRFKKGVLEEVELAVAAVDNFLMAEAVSMLTLPRGRRTDYHCRYQWCRPSCHC